MAAQQGAAADEPQRVPIDPWHGCALNAGASSEPRRRCGSQLSTLYVSQIRRQISEGAARSLCAPDWCGRRRIPFAGLSETQLALMVAVEAGSRGLAWQSGGSEISYRPFFSFEVVRYTVLGARPDVGATGAILVLETHRWMWAQFTVETRIVKGVYPGFPTLFWGLSVFFVGDLMGKALWKLVENAARFPRRGGRVLYVHGAVSFHRARPCGPRWLPGRGAMRHVELDRRVLGLQSTGE